MGMASTMDFSGIETSLKTTISSVTGVSSAIGTGGVNSRNFCMTGADIVTIISFPGCNTVDNNISCRINSSSDWGSIEID